jgi:hypothetical protein
MPAQSSRRSRGSGAKADTNGPATSQEQPIEEAEAAGESDEESSVSRRRQMSTAEQAALRRKLRDKFH